MSANKELLEKIIHHRNRFQQTPYSNHVYKMLESAVEGEHPVFDESMCRALLTLDYPLNACAQACVKKGADTLDEMAECLFDYTQGLAVKFYQGMGALDQNIVNEFINRLQGYYLVDCILQDDFRYAAHIYNGTTRAAAIERRPLRLLLHEGGASMRNVELLFESVRDKMTRDHNNDLSSTRYESNLEDAEEPEP